MDYHEPIRSEPLRIGIAYKAYFLSNFRHKFNAMVPSGLPKIISMEEIEMDDFPISRSPCPKLLGG